MVFKSDSDSLGESGGSGSGVKETGVRVEPNGPLLELYPLYLSNTFIVGNEENQSK
jgi:hypothetical protein